MAFHILVASYTDQIYTLSFDPQASSLSLKSAVKVGDDPSWITSHPNDPSLVFAALEQSEGKIVILKYGTDGQGHVVGEVPSGGSSPCALYATTDELFIANYMTGTVATYPISITSPYIALASPIFAQLTGTGPDLVRQSSSHPHQVVMHRDRPELLVPDLGADITWRFAKDDMGLWNLNGQIQYTPGSGPRHIALHDGILYTLHELTSTVDSHRLPPLPEDPLAMCTSSTYLDPPKSPHDRPAAEILIPKPNSSFPTAYLYASNRNDPSPEGDSIAIFCIENPNTLELVGEFRTGLKHVRGMVFGGQDDRWLVVGGVKGGGVKVLERIDGGRHFKVASQNEDIKAPSGFLWSVDINGQE